ncbi:MAG: acyl carrier protein, partial [Candidatus Omnitrophica bacterium]|nr:acyl carrier protein [Candidatus Omnitrophota bacterium]
LENGLGIDSTEMVEIAVAIKKQLNVSIADNELKKSHTFNEIIGILKTKGAA